MKTIPLDSLVGACCFKKLKRFWPKGIPVSLASVRTAVENDLDIGWAAWSVLPNVTADEFSRSTGHLRDAHYAKLDTAWVRLFSGPGATRTKEREYRKVKRKLRATLNRELGMLLLPILKALPDAP